MFREDYPAAWFYHNNTIRWPFNILEPEDEPWGGAAFKEYPSSPIIKLPPPSPLTISINEAIRRRLSCRSFTSTQLTLEQLSTILSVGNGVHGPVQLGVKEHLERPMPSGGGLYPLEFYLIVRDVEDLPAGLYHYAPLINCLERLRLLELTNSDISQLFMNQPYVATAGFVLIMSAVVERSMHKYGERGYRYILLEAGHSAQNMCLASIGLELGALPIGGFFDGYVSELFQLDQEKEPLLYALAFGHPSTDDRVHARNLTALNLL